MISRRRLATLVLAPAALFLIETSCDRVPLLAPSGSSIALTTATSVLPINGTAVIVAQVIESGGTAPQSGTHVTFTTSLGTIRPTDAQTDSNGQATAIFTSDSSGTATIAAISGSATTGTNTLKILVGTAAVQKVVVNASPATVPSIGGSTTVSATVFDVNGNLMNNVPVTFTTTAGTLSAGVVNTSAAGNASVTLTTAITATVTASVGVGASTTPTTPTTPGSTPTTPTTPSASGTASGTVVVNIAGAPTIVITPPTTPPSAGVPASFTIAVTVPATNGSAVKSVTVEWGDGSATELGSVTGSAIVSHVFKEAGTYAIKVTATDASGNTVSVTSVVSVIVAASPTIIITPSVPTTHSNSMVVSFAIQVTVPSGIGVTSVTINFGDGVTSSLGGLTGTATVNHNYGGNAGAQNILVTVIDTLSRTTTGQTSITLP
jgi:hypothetical protein